MAIKNEFIKAQLDMQKQICLTNQFNAIKYVAGVDLAYYNVDDTEHAVCAIVVLDYETKEVVEIASYTAPTTILYIPGCLSFREMPVFLKANELLNTKVDLYMFDGNGYLHPRNMGLATHAGIILDLPTIGVAKNYFKVQDTDYIMPAPIKGAYENIIVNGKVYGCVLRSRTKVKPIFVSVGNNIDLQTSRDIVISLTSKESRIPLPTRLADIEANRLRKIAQSI
ncbi:endonuclease V [Candidatus Epulonipiscium fishelsonii]|uniref:Endonuclease V n=1 Tax=Candidatus Epulonipiscium fishelsonii TaxID=77094 RepID=A0ACC8XG27_9FIRM|nr:endonuclease V [Epulopiscium sp. SCG-B11WGA-EpuloA1]ONI42977.1 endonuclease V [Epulopiscium sp. SCG-B05WGA-EpuloA1]ONI48025.1 endonuclease V [Epulopiscium sp. SCG-C06WGA-EpuloA1]